MPSESCAQADGAGKPQPLTQSKNVQYPWSFTPDGKRLAFMETTASAFQLWTLLPVENDSSGPGSFSRTMVSIAERDLSGITLIPAPRVSIPGEVVWDGAPPATATSAKLQIIVSPLARAFGRLSATPSAIPGSFTLDLLMDDYSLDFGVLPTGAYIKDITYGGRSVLHRVFRPGTATGEVSLRVILALDGGRITANVTDKDGNPLPDVRVVMEGVQYQRARASFSIPPARPEERWFRQSRRSS